jgi:hypothetical protein
MNKKFYMFLAVILVWASPGGSRDLTVLDYYVMIPARLLSINPEYPSKFTIRQKQGRYTADSWRITRSTRLWTLRTAI